ncbi:hypothetical protein Rrhod_1842 [Rhodococcus rhodnii LMG 5362]|uniref:Transcriptional regulator WhiB n=1 Tax=Rhodococcus rhodnii LMG 5362 TaxID=1273125 RepID=R7WN54_9NOCA|nr:hypothetical protein Rrhod_1842 [Rhodococcus rhodnii LMG 5362]
MRKESTMTVELTRTDPMRTETIRPATDTTRPCADPGEEWKDQGSCAALRHSSTDFFPEHRGTDNRVASAVAVCRGCPVAAQCLAYALTHDERWGIWGGVNMHGVGDVRRAVLREQLEQRSRAARSAAWCAGITPRSELSRR